MPGRHECDKSGKVSDVGVFLHLERTVATQPHGEPTEPLIAGQHDGEALIGACPLLRHGGIASRLEIGGNVFRIASLVIDQGAVALKQA